MFQVMLVLEMVIHLWALAINLNVLFRREIVTALKLGLDTSSKMICGLRTLDLKPN